MLINPMSIVPMLPEEADQPFDDERYIFEPKIDGQRLLLTMENGVVRLRNRHGREVTDQYPELCRVPSSDGADVVLDGVAAAYDPESGAFSREAVMERFLMRKRMDIREASVLRPVHFFVFDLLHYDGEDLRGRTLRERRAQLERTVDDNRFFRRLLALDGQGISLFEAIRGEGLEGIVAKRLDSTYTGGRDANWLAVRKYRYADVRIAGYRKRGFGWLLERQGRRVGVTEAGVPAAHKEAFQGVAKAIVTGEDRDYVYVKPVLGARVRYLRLTREGDIESPEFVRFVG